MRRYLLLWLVLLLVAIAPAADAKIPNYDGQTVDHWQTLLADKDAKVRRKAAYALGRIGPQAQSAVPALGTALSDRQLEVAWYVADALGRIGPAAAPATEALVRVIEETPGDPVLRRSAVIALGRIGPGAKEALPNLKKLLKSDDAETRVAVAEALGLVTRPQQALQKLLIAELKSEGGPGPLAAALALRAYNTAESANALVAMLDTPDADLRRAAVETLGAGGATAIKPLIAVTAKNDPPPNRQSHIAAIDAMGWIADSGRRQFDAALADGSLRPAEGIELKSVREYLVPALIQQLARPDEEVQAAAAHALAKGGELAVPQLVAALVKPDARTTAGARIALGQLQPYLPRRVAANTKPPVDKATLSRLIEALKHRDPAIRAASFRLFAELGISKPSAVASEALRAGLSDPDADIRRHAAAALARLEPN